MRQLLGSGGVPTSKDRKHIAIPAEIEGGFPPMRNFGFVRVILLGLLLCLIPAVSSAAVFVSVGFAPPVLPVYVQPPCPEDGWMWTPGYWAYGDDGYYWVPGT